MKTKAAVEKAELIHYALSDCSLGGILAAFTATGVCAILFGDSPAALLADLQARFPRAERVMATADSSAELLAKVIAFVETPALGLDLPLDVKGSPFQRRVWQALREIPAGSTVSYSEIAQKIGSPKSVRAVAGACAANPIGIAIPCHRVVRIGGALAGFRWGIERKKALLSRETCL
jgi:AraC family transcriptional regulator, regulatory protein of adaptative response / methylated-DNA-[protein]-cysteine methyltransferase